MDNALRADGRSKTVEAEVVDLFLWMLSALLPLRSEISSHRFIAFIHIHIRASRGLIAQSKLVM